jgi:hypothetical protein
LRFSQREPRNQGEGEGQGWRRLINFGPKSVAFFFEKHNAKPHAKQGEPAVEFLRAERETSTEYMNNLQKP